MRYLFLVTAGMLMAVSSFFALSGDFDTRIPGFIRFGETKTIIIPELQNVCTIDTIKEHQQVQLPTVQISQTQIDCSGFLYAGKTRKAEFIFSDNKLDLVRIITEAGEEQNFIIAYSQTYGEPSHKKNDITFFMKDGIGVSSNPSEILLISDRLKEPFRLWLESE